MQLSTALQRFVISVLFCGGIFSFATAQNVGIGTPNPGSKLGVNGNVSVGQNYSTQTAPTDGAIIEGQVGIGHPIPDTAKVLVFDTSGVTVPFQVYGRREVPGGPTTCSGSLPGWSYATPIGIDNSANPTTLTNYQISFTFDTQTPIGLGQMDPNGDDIRILDDDCVTQLDYWIEGPMNSPTTTIWVQVPTIPGNGTKNIFLFYGNAGAPAQSTLNVFEGPHSATDSVTVPNTNNVDDCQRGFRFSPNEDILVAAFGMNVPNGTARWVTVFDFATTNIVEQQEVTANTGYTYDPLPNPFWLNDGTQYLLTLHNKTGDDYYFGTSNQIGQHLTYYDMRFCNGCNQNTFPTSTLTNYHYGLPDFHYYTRQTVTPAPAISVGTTVGGGPPVSSVGDIIYVQPGSGNVGIHTSNPTSTFTVDGDFAATGTKNFDIPHPSDPNRRLVHAALEGPEAGVYYRGVGELVSGTATIELPEYFEALTRAEDRTVHLTNIGHFEVLAVKPYNDGSLIKNGRFRVVARDPNAQGRFSWEVRAIRDDVDPLEVEPTQPIDPTME